MPYLLRFDGTNDRVDIPALTLPSSFEIEIDITYYAATSDRFLFSGFTAGNAGRWYVGTFNNVVWWRLGSGFSAATSTTLVDGTRYKIKLIRSGNDFTLQVDGVTIATRTQAFTMQAFSRIGSSQDPLYFAKIDLYYLSYTDTATPANNRYYDPSGTSSGTTLFDTVGSNDGTLVNFTVPACWVFYSGGAYTLTADGAAFSYSGGIASTIYSRVLSADGGSFNYSGGVAETLLSRRIAADGATFGYSGGVSALLYGRALQAAGGSFSYSGGVATFVYNPITGYVLNADGGIFSYAGGEAALSFNQNYPTANPNDYTVSAYLSTDSTYTARLSETSTINAIISASSTFNARLN